MKPLFSALITILLLCGCTASSSVKATAKAARVVNQASDHSVKNIPISELNSSFLNTGADCKYNCAVVEVTGKVIAYGLTEEGVYTLTLQENDKNALCTFDASISNQLGAGRRVCADAMITVRGQCQSSGLFASQPFSIHGCKISEN